MLRTVGSLQMDNVCVADKDIQIVYLESSAVVSKRPCLLYGYLAAAVAAGGAGIHFFDGFSVNDTRILRVTCLSAIRRAYTEFRQPIKCKRGLFVVGASVNHKVFVRYKVLL